MALKEDKDAGFFGMIHELVEQQPTGKERRTEDRLPFECIQLLAPFDQKTPPQAADFRTVHCNDLSPKGFSFYSPRRPDYKYVIVALGKVPFSFFSAEVVRCQKADDSVDDKYLIGCRFTGRLTNE